MAMRELLIPSDRSSTPQSSERCTLLIDKETPSAANLKCADTLIAIPTRESDMQKPPSRKNMMRFSKGDLADLVLAGAGQVQRYQEEHAALRELLEKANAKVTDQQAEIDRLNVWADLHFDEYEAMRKWLIEERLMRIRQLREQKARNEREHLEFWRGPEAWPAAGASKSVKPSSE